MVDDAPPGMATIDLNCDMGESFGRWSLGADTELTPLVTSVNIAAGLHAGDPGVIEATVASAKQHGTAVGAHPGYPDLQGFGRRAMSLSPDEVEAMVLYQIGAVYAFARAAGVDLIHVKPHGALYNHAARDRATAEAIARAVRRFDRGLILVGLASSALIEAGEQEGLRVAPEAFADRAYNADGSLRGRNLPGAVLTDVEQVLRQAIAIARDRQVVAYDGACIALAATTICLHGDTPGAIGLARALREGLATAGVVVRPLREIVAPPATRG